MGKIIALSIFILSGVVGLALLFTQKAECYSCQATSCRYESDCGAGCDCARELISQPGVCVSN